MRRRPVWCLHHSAGGYAPPLLPALRQRSRWKIHHHYRRFRAQRPTPSRAAGFSRSRRISVRILHVGNDRQQHRAIAKKSKPQRCRNRTSPAGKYLPLRHASANRRSGTAGRQSHARSKIMNTDGSVDIPTNPEISTSNPCTREKQSVPAKQAPEARHTLAQPVRAGSEDATNPSAVGAGLSVSRPDAFVPEPERYELRSGALHHFNLQRRDFFKVMGAGIAIFTIAANAATPQESGAHRQNRDQDQPKDISSWLHINDDGIVTVFTGKVEIGQNTRTTLAQSVADELRVPLASIRMVMGDTALTPFDMGTFGSRSTPYMSPQLRRAASAARDLLLEQAAAKWNTSADKLVVSDGKISNPATGATLTYAQLAQGKTLAHDLPDADPITPPTEWT